MKTFFKPTKAKVILAVLLLPFTFILVQVVYSFAGYSSGTLCLPSLPSVSREPLPTPTPQPFTISNVVSDMQYESYTSGGANCLGNGPTEYVATFLFTSYQTIFAILFFAFPFVSSYLISCTILFFIAKMRPQKKNNTAKSKK